MTELQKEYASFPQQAERYAEIASALLGLQERSALNEVEPDGGKLKVYFGNDLQLGTPGKYYPYAQPEFGAVYRPMKKEWLNSLFRKEAVNHPEKYAVSILAWLDRVGRVTLDKEHTDEIVHKICQQVSKSEPIRLCLTYSLQKYPLADPGVDIKCFDASPDLAELEMLHVLVSLSRSIQKNVYPPGLKYTLLNEATAFTRFPSPDGNSEGQSFENKIQSWLGEMGWQDIVKVESFIGRCTEKTGYMDIVQKKFGEYLKLFQGQGVGDNPFVKAEARSVYWPGIDLQPDSAQLLRIYSVSGAVPILGMAGQWDSMTKSDWLTWGKILDQARVQAAYFRAFMDTRQEVGGVLYPDEVAVTVTSAENKISIPVINSRAQEKATHWNKGVQILPGHGTGIMTAYGVAVLPAYKALKLAKGIKYSEEMDLFYLYN